RRLLKQGATCDMEEAVTWLVAHGYQPAEAVELPGEFSRRGGILDVFSPDAEAPYRVEFFGDEIDSIRQFAPETQRSLGNVPSALLMGLPHPDTQAPVDPAPFCDSRPAGAWTLLVESEELHEQGKHYLERVTETTGLFSVEGAFQQLWRFPSVKVSALPSPTV